MDCLFDALVLIPVSLELLVEVEPGPGRKAAGSNVGLNLSTDTESYAVPDIGRRLHSML